jgi:hypothetical protein
VLGFVPLLFFHNGVSHTSLHEPNPAGDALARKGVPLRLEVETSLWLCCKKETDLLRLCQPGDIVNVGACLNRVLQ